MTMTVPDRADYLADFITDLAANDEITPGQARTLRNACRQVLSTADGGDLPHALDDPAATDELLSRFIDEAELSDKTITNYAQSFRKVVGWWRDANPIDDTEPNDAIDLTAVQPDAAGKTVAVVDVDWPHQPATVDLVIDTPPFRHTVTVPAALTADAARALAMRLHAITGDQ